MQKARSLEQRAFDPVDGPAVTYHGGRHAQDQPAVESGFIVFLAISLEAYRMRVPLTSSRFRLHPDATLDLTGDQFAHIFPTKIETPLPVGMKAILAKGFRQAGKPDLLQQYDVPI